MSDKKYYLGIDGGGSKTAFAIIDEKDELVFFKECGPSSLDTYPLEKIKQVFTEGVNSFPYKVDSVFAGIGGISNQQQIDDVNKILKSLPVCDANTMVNSGNDVINALYGSLKGEDGIVLIAGTGSVCFGKKDDKYARSGGYCYQEGDAGSGYYLGYRALQHLARVIDHRYEETEFSKQLAKEICCFDYQSLASFFINANRTKIASLSKIVTMNQNDKYAKKIIEDAVEEVLLMIKAVYNQLNFEDQKVNFSIVGSLGNADTLYKKLLMDGLKNISPNIYFVQKRCEAYIGSALKAKEVV